MIRAAGVVYIAGNKALFLKRGPAGDHVGEWCFPGGKIEDGEAAIDAAKREFLEETGREIVGDLRPWTRRIAADPVIAAPADALVPLAPPEQCDFATFVFPTGEEFVPKLNDEHCAYAWAPIESPPEPLHPGCRVALSRFGADELAIARMMMAGDLTSPQQYENLWLFDLRITGTGAAFRSKHNEYVIRKPEAFLTEEFVARCNGLPVIWEHPPSTMLDSKEYAERNIGSIFLPYIKGDEVWGIAKILDQPAAVQMAKTQLSTSPGVKASASLTGAIEIDGKTSSLLVEDEPKLVDHLAVCAAGVWDKGQEPSGVRAETRGDSVMPEGSEGVVPDKILAALDSMGKRFDARLDAMEEEMKADKKRRADAEGEMKKADAKKRADSHAFSKRGDAEDEESYKKRHDAEEDKLKCDWEEAGEAKELAADKAKKARKDAEDKDEEERKADKARKDAASLAAQVSAPVAATNTKADARADSDPAMLERLSRVESAIPKLMSDADYEVMANEQQRADAVYQAHGKRAPGPLQSESPMAYARRILRDFQGFSERCKNIDLVKLSAEPTAFGQIKDMIYADAIAAAARPSDLGAGELRTVKRTNPVTGLPFYEFVSGGGTFIGTMKPPTQVRQLNAAPRGAR